MILSDGEIREIIKSKDLSIEPLINENIQPASIDITLSNCYCELLKIDGDTIDIREPQKYVNVKTDQYVLKPNSFVLASTNEYISMPTYLSAFVEGRSSIGRLGLFVQNAGWIDPGFEGTITLELFNVTKYPILLPEGIKIGQIVFARMDRRAVAPYSGKYQGQVKTTGSRMYMDFNNY